MDAWNEALEERQRQQHRFPFVLFSLLRILLDNSDLSVVQAVGQLSTVLQSKVRTYTKSRIHAALSPWIAHPLEFRDILRRTRSVISGSLALSVALDDQWRANDLDIYVPYRTPKSDVIAHIIDREGYHIQAVVARYTPVAEGDQISPLDSIAGITRITKFLKMSSDCKTTKIDLIESTDYNALTPILKFDSTWSMNWITADSITVAYPRLTLRHEGVFSKTQVLKAYIHLPSWKSKYLKERGFSRFHITSRLVDEPCRELCFPLLRTSLDEHCLTVAFGEALGRSTYPEKVWGIRGIAPTASCGNVACPNFCLTYREVNWYCLKRLAKSFRSAEYL